MTDNYINDFYEVISPKPKWIPKDIDDYFRQIPNDLPRIKYDRLLEIINKDLKVDLEWLFSNTEPHNYAGRRQKYHKLEKKYLKGEDKE